MSGLIDKIRGILIAWPVVPEGWTQDTTEIPNLWEVTFPAGFTHVVEAPYMCVLLDKTAETGKTPARLVWAGKGKKYVIPTACDLVKLAVEAGKAHELQAVHLESAALELGEAVKVNMAPGTVWSPRRGRHLEAVEIGKDGTLKIMPPSWNIGRWIGERKSNVLKMAELFGAPVAIIDEWAEPTVVAYPQSQVTVKKFFTPENPTGAGKHGFGFVQTPWGDAYFGKELVKNLIALNGKLPEKLTAVFYQEKRRMSVVRFEDENPREKQPKKASQEELFELREEILEVMTDVNVSVDTALGNISISLNQETYSGWNVSAKSLEEAIAGVQARRALWEEWNARALAIYEELGLKNPGNGNIQIYPSPLYNSKVGIGYHKDGNKGWVHLEKQLDGTWKKAP